MTQAHQPAGQAAADPHATTHHDLVIVGGGLVGASLAIALQHLPLNVALVEATPAGEMPAVFDQRNLSFAAATVNALTALGVMQRLQAPVGPIRRIHISRQGDFGRVQLDARQYQREFFGQVVVARDFGEALESRLRQLPRLTRYRPARFVGLGPLTGQRRSLRIVDAHGERELTCNLLVAADGSHSAVRAALAIPAQSHDYQQTLFVSRMRAEQAPDGTAYERFTRAGPTALLPRGDRHFGVVHGVLNDDADAVAALDDAGWMARIQTTFGWRVGRFVGSGERSRYPIVRHVAERLTDSRAVLLGNAAQTIHPIGAQGFNLGLRDALTLAELLADNLDQGSDPGDARMLARYAQRRGEDRQRTLEFSDGLARITANDAPLLAPLRGLGLVAADASTTLQSYLVGGAMGFRGDVPALCREVSA